MKTTDESIRFYNYRDVMHLLGVGRSTAYALIRRLNGELIAKGYEGIIPGRIPSRYFKERVYG